MAPGATPGATIAQCTPYTFCHGIGGCGLSDTVSNFNEFKKLQGVLGQGLRSVDGSAVAGAQVTLTRIDNKAIVGTATTDFDGYYAIPWKHTGKAAMYRVDLVFGNQKLSGQVELKANGWGNVEFDLTKGTVTAEFGFGGK